MRQSPVPRHTTDHQPHEPTRIRAKTEMETTATYQTSSCIEDSGSECVQTLGGSVHNENEKAVSQKCTKQVTYIHDLRDPNPSIRRKSYPNVFTCGKQCPKGHIYCTSCSRTSYSVIERSLCRYCGSEFGRRSFKRCIGKSTDGKECDNTLPACRACVRGGQDWSANRCCECIELGWIYNSR